MVEPSLTASIAELKRELSMRRSVYPGLIARGKMSQATADKQTQRLECALENLQDLHNLLDRTPLASIRELVARLDQPALSLNGGLS